MLSQAMENYLKTIFEVLEKNERATTSAIAGRLEVAPASVTAMIKKLAQLNLVTHKRYQGVMLTRVGEQAALEILRHHRLLELYLAEALGVPWDQVHEEAEKLEHVLSEDLEDRIAHALGDPKVDPHGAPIPARDGSMLRVDARELSAVNAGETVTVVEVDDRDPELLKFLGELRLYPGAKIEVSGIEPYDGPFMLKVNGRDIVLGRHAATRIRVTAA
jgi:DtxR family Mn-dependent transcriptional regulator